MHNIHCVLRSSAISLFIPPIPSPLSSLYLKTQITDGPWQYECIHGRWFQAYFLSSASSISWSLLWSKEVLLQLDSSLLKFSQRVASQLPLCPQAQKYRGSWTLCGPTGCRLFSLTLLWLTGLRLLSFPVIASYNIEYSVLILELRLFICSELAFSWGCEGSEFPRLYQT